MQRECLELFEESVRAGDVGHSLAMLGAEGGLQAVAGQNVTAGEGIEGGDPCLHYREHILQPPVGDQNQTVQRLLRVVRLPVQ